MLLQIPALMGTLAVTGLKITLFVNPGSSAKTRAVAWEESAL